MRETVQEIETDLDFSNMKLNEDSNPASVVNHESNRPDLEDSVRIELEREIKKPVQPQGVKIKHAPSKSMDNSSKTGFISQRKLNEILQTKKIVSFKKA